MKIFNDNNVMIFQLKATDMLNGVSYNKSQILLIYEIIWR